MRLKLLAIKVSGGPLVLVILRAGRPRPPDQGRRPRPAWCG